MLIANSVFSQEIKNGFEIERKTREDGKSSVSYKEVVACPPRMSPKGVNGQDIEFMGSILNSREKLNKIEKSILREEEIKLLSASPCIVHCRINTNGGKVVEVQSTRSEVVIKTPLFGNLQIPQHGGPGIQSETVTLHPAKGNKIK